MNATHRESPAPPPVARVEAHVLRWPVRVPVRTSFGTMHDRPALLVRVEDSEGAIGWGEAWCNFPACGAEHRARLIETVLAPLVAGRAWPTPHDAFAHLSAATAVLAIQSGEPGPIAQAIAGIDIALHDLAARRAGLPLWRLLARDRADGDDARTGTEGGLADGVPIGGVPIGDRAFADARLRIYASGLNPEHVGATVESLRRAGHTAFKLKVGFGAERDLANLAEMRAAAGADAMLMLDANQAWSLDEAIAMAGRLAAAAAPAWLEEPLRADRPWPEWQRLAAASPLPLAAGENAIGDAAFDALIASRAVAVVQPDLAKWGGISGVLPVIERIGAAGLRYCPHYLGAGIGLLASAHVLAARDLGGGLLEVDSNENPLRSALCPPLATLAAGHIRLGAAPGLGVEPDLAALAEMVGRRGG